ncbi:microfibril-associated glycoprotein 4-like [Ruditapes philippinarum]|uniref:microfibril-associated glycoprotein 4-like n=1 Tax=Ruditapes philippinarum TaxID=129788 RepID=UPI00295ABED6|nr:microfibril-associated glycoprotein 4-like [Ruditapes philippinarum]
MISKVSAKQIAVYDKLENVNQLKEITLKLEQVKQKSEDIEDKTAISNEKVDVIAANVERNNVNIERVYSLVTELSTNIKTLLKQMSCVKLLNNGNTQSAVVGEHELRIELEDYDGNSAYAKYSKFKIYPEEDNYKLEVRGYSGNAGDSLDYHNGMMFSTFDRDNETDKRHCAVQFHGAWWYKGCFYSNLNGQYSEKSQKGIRWNKWKVSSLKKVEMKFR